MNNTGLKNKRLFLFDIDGTIAVGDTLLPGACELLSYIEKIGGRAYFITNNSTKSSADYVERFRDVFKLETTEEQFITAGFVTRKFLLENYDGKKIYVLGTKSFIEDLKKHGLNITEKCEADIACAVAAYDSELTYEKLSVASKILLTLDVPFYGTNPDLRCPAPFGFIPDCGSICDMLTSTTDKKPEYLGKPNPEMVKICEELSGFSPKETLVVGDRLYTDIAVGINAGVSTCVLYTGEATPKDVASTEYKPEFEFENVEALYRAVSG
ncbi:MAG: HAD-IIA family hydrolase [Lachnospiraceae bacterium]|nr:HAD-IIA family hydrolase [Lachnospiraceae bacterium]